MAAVLTWVPGLREIRTPLLVGYLLLAAGWLAFEPDIPSSCGAQISQACSDDGVWHTVYRAFDGVGPIAPFAAVSFAAFLVGSVFMTVAGTHVRALVEPAVSDDMVSTLENSILGLLYPGREGELKELSLPEDFDGRHLASSILADWPLVAGVGQQNLPQAAEIGRQNEEVRMRAGISAPVVLVGVAVFERMPDRRGVIALAICVCVAIALLVEARQTAQSTRRTFLYLIAARQVHLPGLIVAAARIDPGVIRRLPTPGPFGS